MSNRRRRPIFRHRLMRTAFVAVGLAAAAITAQAQTEKAGLPTSPKPAAAPSSPDPVGEVTIDGARRRPDATIPADKKAEYDAAAAKDEAFRRYRQSTPPLTADSKGVGDPNDLSKDVPGVQTYLPK